MNLQYNKTISFSTISDIARNIIQYFRLLVKKWWFAFIIIVIVLVTLFFLRTKVSNIYYKGFNFIVAYLPIALPCISVIFSIIVKFKEIRNDWGWVQLPTIFALGLISFAIWYQTSAQKALDPVIEVGPKKYLVTNFSTVFLILSFAIALICITGKLLSEMVPEEKRGKSWVLTHICLLIFSFIAFISPFYIVQPESKLEDILELDLNKRFFSVCIPFRDFSLSNSITQCVVYRQIKAISPDDAINQALKMFDESPISKQSALKTKIEKENPKKVNIIESLIVVQREQGYPKKPKNLNNK